jgi:hypothetical protein
LQVTSIVQLQVFFVLSFEQLKPDILFSNQYKNNKTVSCANSSLLDAVDVIELDKGQMAAITGL